MTDRLSTATQAVHVDRWDSWTQMTDGTVVRERRYPDVYFKVVHRPDGSVDAETRVTSHQTYVQMIHGGGFFAVCCTCGCDDFPARQRLAEAETDAVQHGPLRHIYSAQNLAAHDEHTHRTITRKDTNA